MMPRRSFPFVLAALSALALALDACGPPPQPVTHHPVDLYAHVDPFIGTGGIGWGTGSDYPGPTLPFAMAHPGPDTRAAGGQGDWDHCAGYAYADPMIAGFSLTRMEGTGVPDYGNFGFMPVDGMDATKTAAGGYEATYDHANESARPGYYEVTLDSGIHIEVTSTLRAAIFRFTFPSGTDPVVLLDAAHALGVGKTGPATIHFNAAAGTGRASTTDLGRLSGYPGGFQVYTAFKVSPRPASVGTWDDSSFTDGRTGASGTKLGGWFEFPSGTQTVVLKAGVSFTGTSGALKNLDTEIPGFDFDAVAASAKATWQKTLKRVEIDDVGEPLATELATAVYHTQLMPTLMSDVDGSYVVPSPDFGADTIAQSSVPQYSDFSLWDTYRSLHPWLVLTENPANAGFAASLVRFGKDAGALPRWSLASHDAHSMVGDPATIVLADLAAGGVEFDQAAGYAAARTTAFGPAPGAVGGRSDITGYMSAGYVPADEIDGSVSRTLEYVSADLALAHWAKALGHTDDADVLTTRANAAWRALYDDGTGFFRPKNTDGSWGPLDDPTGVNDAYVEGDAWQYLWMVPQDTGGLAEVLGGKDKAVSRLTTFFDDSKTETPILGTRVYDWPANEPDIVAPWLFAAWGHPAGTYRWNKWIIDTTYGTGPDGLPGNDDSGTMSAWLLFAAAGIYPIPGYGQYMLGIPLVPRMVLHRPSGDLVIEADPALLDQPKDNRFVWRDDSWVPTDHLGIDELRGNVTLDFAPWGGAG